jgi:diazepam-binding inhibitor (GABA receptor modulating acyl-CoA-binding protein)
VSSRRTQHAFQTAVDYIQSLPPTPKDGSAAPISLSNEEKLRFYGLYKQATLGNNTHAKPGWLDPVGRAKWSAWQACFDKPPDVAMREYVDALLAIVSRLPPRPEVAAFVKAIGAADDGGLSSSSSEPLPVTRGSAPPLHTPLYPAAAVPITPITMRVSNGSSSSDELDGAGSDYHTDDGEDDLLRAVNASHAMRDEQHSAMVDKLDVVETRLQRLQSLADSLAADLRRLQAGWFVRAARAAFVVSWPFVAFALCYALLKWRRRRLRFVQ